MLQINWYFRGYTDPSVTFRATHFRSQCSALLSEQCKMLVSSPPLNVLFSSFLSFSDTPQNWSEQLLCGTSGWRRWRRRHWQWWWCCRLWSWPGFRRWRLRRRFGTHDRKNHLWHEWHSWLSCAELLWHQTSPVSWESCSGFPAPVPIRGTNLYQLLSWF